jgi:hypothetical protein
MKESILQNFYRLISRALARGVSDRERKTHVRRSPQLRSQQREGVVQEIYGLLIARFIVRKLAIEASTLAGVTPRRISFTATINVLRARLPKSPWSRQLILSWYESLLEEIRLDVLPPRRNRLNPRVIKVSSNGNRASGRRNVKDTVIHRL